MEIDGKSLKMELRSHALSEYATFVSKCESALKLIHTYDPSKQQRLINAISHKLDTVTTPNGCKSLTASLRNELSSYNDCVGSKLLAKMKPTTFTKVRLTCKAKIEKLNEQVEKVKAGVDDLFMEEMDKQSQQVLQRTNSELGKLQSIQKRKWAVVRAPVVPVGNNAYINLEKLKKTFDVNQIGGYAVMHNQLCLGINKQYLAKAGIKNLKAYVKELIEYLSAERGVDYVLLFDKGIISNLTGVNVVWYWLMTPQEAKRFRECFRNYQTKMSDNTYGISTIAIRDWGFANGS